MLLGWFSVLFFCTSVSIGRSAFRLNFRLSFSLTLLWVRVSDSIGLTVFRNFYGHNDVSPVIENQNNDYQCDWQLTQCTELSVASRSLTRYRLYRWGVTPESAPPLTPSLFSSGTNQCSSIDDHIAIWSLSKKAVSAQLYTERHSSRQFGSMEEWYQVARMGAKTSSSSPTLGEHACRNGGHRRGGSAASWARSRLMVPLWRAARRSGGAIGHGERWCSLAASDTSRRLSCRALLATACDSSPFVFLPFWSFSATPFALLAPPPLQLGFPMTCPWVSSVLRTKSEPGTFLVQL